MNRIKSLLNYLRTLSSCKDKQVAACCVKDGVLISMAINIKDHSCNFECNHSCNPIHAEQALYYIEGCEVYVSLFPCENCQRYMYEQGVTKIIYFSDQHKVDLGLIPIVKGD